MKHVMPFAPFLGIILAACSSSSFKGSSGSKAAVSPDAGTNATAAPAASAGAADPSSGDAAPGSPTVGVRSASALPPPANLNFGLLVTDLNCTFCHLEIHGTVVSVGDVPPLREDSHGRIFGRWLASGAYNATKMLTNPPKDNGIVVDGGVLMNYNNSGKELPVMQGTSTPAFPALDFATLGSAMQGLVAIPGVASSLPISKSFKGNAVLIGTAANPIVINRDVLIDGDLIIKGVYRGVGTIYVTGNIYIPANLKAASLASFPYSDDQAAASSQGMADVKAAKGDALGLAAAKNIFLGDIENYMDSGNKASSAPNGLHGTRYTSIYAGAAATDPLSSSSTGVWDVYSWYPEAQFEKLYEEGTPCWTSSNRSLVAGHHWGERQFSEIDAFLYASEAIGGIDRAANWTINGGAIARVMHIVSGAGSDSVNANKACGASRLNFDYRLQNGLQVLEHLGELLPTKS